MHLRKPVAAFYQQCKNLISAHRSTLLNFFSLGFLRGTDALIQLLLIPVIIQRVGIANYGIIAFVQVLLNYGKSIIDYGFHISGVRQIALAGGDQKELNRLFCLIFLTRAGLAMVFLSALYLLVIAIPVLQEKATAFYWGALYITGHLLVLDWFFIGLQKAQVIALANLLSKLLFAVLVLILVKDEWDYPYVLAYQGLGATAVGLALLFYLARRYSFCWIMPGFRAMTNILKEDLGLLYTHFILEFNATYSILILNVLTTNALTGYFSVMYKLIQPIRLLLVIFAQTIFPAVCQKAEVGWRAAAAYLRSAFLLFLGFPLCCCLLLFLFAEPLLIYFSGDTTTYFLESFRLYLLAPVIILCNIPAFQLLLTYEQKKAYAGIHLISLCLKIAMDYLFIQWFYLKGLIVSILLVELFITLGLYYVLARFRTYTQKSIA